MTGVSCDNAVVSAARVSFLGESKGDERDRKLIDYLMRNEHSSPFEQVEFKYRVKAPLVTYWQWVRHRTFSFQSINSQSGRYVEFDEDEYYAVPIDQWRKQASDNKQASDGFLDVIEGAKWSAALEKHYDRCYALYDAALEAGVAREQARLFLPGFAVYYTWIVKVDMLNLFNFLRLRMDRKAQYEIRVYADAIHEMTRPFAPWSFEAFEKYQLHKGE